ncbi:MAG: phage gp6-like head-tail connector protein [Clostridiales bacterium]|nr:phage gp6-like head-tail connector protein [Clostridiales bacterium]
MVLTVDEVKQHLRIEYDEEDELIEKLIQQAQAAAEDFCRVSFEEDVPEPVRLACLLFVSYHYENRDIPDMTTYKSMRMAFEHLLYPHRDPAQMF